MDHYYVNDQPQITGEHEVHKEGCAWMPSIVNRSYLGCFPACQPAVIEARKKFFNVDGCFWCCRDCHTR